FTPASVWSNALPRSYALRAAAKSPLSSRRRPKLYAAIEAMMGDPEPSARSYAARAPEKSARSWRWTAELNASSASMSRPGKLGACIFHSRCEGRRFNAQLDLSPEALGGHVQTRCPAVGESQRLTL